MKPRNQRTVRKKRGTRRRRRMTASGTLAARGSVCYQAQDNRTAAGGAWYELTRAGGMGFLQGLWLLGAQSATRTQDNRTAAGGAWYELAMLKHLKRKKILF